MADTYNRELLQEEVDAAGIPNFGVTSAGGIVFRPEATTQQREVTFPAVLAAHNPAGLSKQQEIDAARAAIVAGRKYLQRQLASASPDSLTTLVNTIKPAVDGNTYLLRMVNNKIDVMVLAFGWTAADVKTPTTAANRARYVEACCQIIALLNGNGG